MCIEARKILLSNVRTEFCFWKEQSERFEGAARPPSTLIARLVARPCQRLDRHSDPLGIDPGKPISPHQKIRDVTARGIDDDLVDMTDQAAVLGVDFGPPNPDADTVEGDLNAETTAS